jgi:hypothetical protein
MLIAGILILLIYIVWAIKTGPSDAGNWRDFGKTALLMGGATWVSQSLLESWGVESETLELFYAILLMIAIVVVCDVIVRLFRRRLDRHESSKTMDV